MNPRSIRFRLTLWYSLAFFVSTAIIFAAFYLITKQTLLSHTDSRINSHGDALVKIAENGQSNMMFGVFNQGIIAQQFSEMPGMLVIITDSTGKIVASSQTGANENPVIKDLIEKSTAIIKPTFVERTIGSSILRIGVFPVINNGSTIGLVFMGDPVEAIYRSLNSLLLSLATVYFLLFIPTIIGAHLLAGSAMRPISQISQKLKNISSKNLEEKVPIPKTKDELEELATTFNSLLERLSAAFVRERQFIGDVAHEMKTPLATMRSNVEVVLGKDRAKKEYRDALSETLIDVDQLSSTLTNVLDLAWSQADQPKVIKDSFNLSELVSEVLDLTHKLASEKQINVSGKIQNEIFIAGRRDKMMRAILNVVDNAIKYTPGMGRIEINLKEKNREAVLEVIDTGLGISKEELPHVFERFYRGSKTDQILGSGLGLAISHSIITVHQGTIHLDSSLEKGTKVTITLPAIKV